MVDRRLDVPLTIGTVGQPDVIPPYARRLEPVVPETSGWSWTSITLLGTVAVLTLGTVFFLRRR